MSYDRKERISPREQALRDAEWFLARARRRLWHGFGVRHDLEQVRLAINALREEGEAEVHRVNPC